MIYRKEKIYWVFLLFLGLQVAFGASKKDFHYAGRIEVIAPNKVVLIGAASSVTFDFVGTECAINLQSVDVTAHHNFVSIELDGTYLGRFEVKEGAMQVLTIPVMADKKVHRLSIYKATEAITGMLVFGGTTAKVIPSAVQKKKRIEFIGDSITCGFGNDTAAIPCNTGLWYDQHNAYLSYAPVVARSLGVDYSLSAVSGYGMYRNWNDEHTNPNLPDVYENLYLDANKEKPFGTEFNPKIVTILLGTNDLSAGDGTKERLPFDANKYITNYIEFIKTVFKRYPKTKIVLLNSPMVTGERNDFLVGCIKKVMHAFENDKKHKKIALFEFQEMTPGGCGNHPNIADDVVMAKQLEGFLKKILHEN